MTQEKPRKCNKCKKYYDLSFFLNKKCKKTTISCKNCRTNKSSRTISVYQNKKEKIFAILEKEKIHRIHIYNIYKAQDMKCYICNDHIKMEYTHVNKFNREQKFKNNMFITCLGCYYLNEDMDIDEFRAMMNCVYYPFYEQYYENKIRI